MKTTYTFAALRYVHDAVTQEFVNVGVVLYAPDAQFLRARCNPHYGRISKTFGKIDGPRLTQLTHHIESAIGALESQLVESALPFEESARSFEKLIALALPPDDSALQFVRISVGVTLDPASTLDELYDRYVDRYTARADKHRRDDDEIWRVFRPHLDRKFLTSHLSAKLITSPDYEYRFEHALKNGHWHAFEPVSLDLLEADSIIDKALRWQARLENLAESREPFQVSLLLGLPSDPSLGPAIQKAERILAKARKHSKSGIPVVEIVKEAQAEQLAETVESLLANH